MSAPAAYVGVIGASDACERELELASAVGSGLARAGAVLVCGGLGGVMEAACAGAKRDGGLTIGVLPGSDRSAANAHVDVALPTGLGELRNGLVVRFSDALIAIGGGWGTLSELAFAMRTGRPLVALGSWRATLEEASQRAATRGSEEVDAVGVPRRVGDPDEAVRVALSLARDAG